MSERNSDEKSSKKATGILRESEERYRSLFENSLNGVLLMKPDGAILEANPMACRLLGRTKEEIRQEGRAGIGELSKWEKHRQ